jgi:hypothetical protein
MRAFVNVVEDGMLWAECCTSITDVSVKLDLYHMPTTHATTFGEAMDERFV